MAGYTEAQIKDAIRNADKAGDSAAVLALGKRLAAMRQQPQAQPAPEKQQPWYQSALSGFERGIKPVADFVSSFDSTKYAANAVTDYFAPGSRQRVENALAAQAQQAQRQNPYSYGGGKLVGNIVATLPVGPMLGTVARGVTAGTKVARVGEAVAKGLSSGGLKTGLTPTREAVKAGTAAAPTLGARAADLAIRAGTGATTGAVSAGLTGDDAAAAATIGALVPTAGAAVGRVALDKVILPAYERVTQQFGKVRAAAILREAFGMPIDAVIALARNAPEGVPFAKVLAQAGKEEPAVQALAAKMAQGPGKHIYAPIERAETEAQQAALNAMAKGGTEREARNAFAEGRKAIGADYAAAEAKAFERANLGGKTIPRLSAQAVMDEQKAAANSALARRMAFGAERAETRLGQMDDLGDQFNPQALNVVRGQAGAMGQRAETAAQQAIRLREESAAARQQIADLNAQGINALETGPVAAQICSMKRAEGLSKTQRAALESVAQDIESHGPIIRAGDLDAIRSDANVTIANLLGASTDVGGIKKATADLLGRIKGPIDNAIENAGGVGLKEAKAEFAQGATDLERQQFASDLAGMFEKDPTKFARTVRGERGTTGAVEEAFPRAGARNFDIQEMMGVPGGAAGPSRMPALENIAQDVELKGRMAMQADEGGYRADELLKNPPQELDIFHRLSPVNLAGRLGSGALQFLRVIDAAPFDAATKQALAQGLRSGKSVEDLLTTLPLADRVQMKQRMASYGLFAPRNIVNAMGRNTSNAMFNAATAVPSDQNQNAMAGY
jgi:hypothetical protein